MSRPKEFADTAKAMKNIIEGYGDSYIVPTYSLLDNLADEFGYADAGTEAGCMAHARRKFFELQTNHQSQITGEALEYFQKLYAIERDVAELDTEDRRRFTPAVCSDWRAVSRFHVGTDQRESTIDAGYTTACASYLPHLSISFLALWGSPYTPG